MNREGNGKIIQCPRRSHVNSKLMKLCIMSHNELSVLEIFVLNKRIEFVYLMPGSESIKGRNFKTTSSILASEFKYHVNL